MNEYKGINLTKINGIQKINFPKTMTDSVSVRLAFEKFDTKALDEVGKCIQNHVEKLFQKQVEDTEMFIICEMAKMFLEEKEKWNVLWNDWKNKQKNAENIGKNLMMKILSVE